MDEVDENVLRFLDKLWHEFLEQLRFKSKSGTRITLITKEGIMSNYQLNAGDSVVVTITDADAVTGNAVAVDAGSVTAVLSSPTDTVAVDPSGLFATVKAGTTVGTGNTLTVNATVGGVASKSFVATYDVVAATADATTLSATFGTETGPTGTTAPLTAAQLAALGAAGVSSPVYTPTGPTGTPTPLTAAQLAALGAAGVSSPVYTPTGPTGTPTPLTAAQLAALGAAGIPFTAFPLTAAQSAALVAAGVPSADSSVASTIFGNVVGQYSPTTGLLNT